jgi:hypothetical protein
MLVARDYPTVNLGDEPEQNHATDNVGCSCGLQLCVSIHVVLDAQAANPSAAPADFTAFLVKDQT